MTYTNDRIAEAWVNMLREADPEKAERLAQIKSRFHHKCTKAAHLIMCGHYCEGNNMIAEAQTEFRNSYKYLYSHWQTHDRL